MTDKTADTAKTQTAETEEEAMESGKKTGSGPTRTRRVQFVEHHQDSTFAVEKIALQRAEFNIEQEPDPEDEGPFETKAKISNETVALGDERHSVSLTVDITRERDDVMVFRCMACYTGVFVIQGLSEEGCHETLMTRCLDMLYPYVSTTVAQLAGQAGFQGMQLVPLSFGALYRNEKREQQQWEEMQDTMVRH